MTSNVPEKPDDVSRIAWGVGLATHSRTGTILDTWFPRTHRGSVSADHSSETAALASSVSHDDRRQVHTEVVSIVINLDEPPASTPDAYLRLHLLSHLHAEPNTINLDGLFSHLPTVAWTTVGPLLPETAAEQRESLRRDGIGIIGVDKFPRLLDYVVPERVRIADAARVRLGAHLAPGTTVMHEGFVNFNAGTLGTSMVEGRISQGVVVGDGSDIGGGASIMGTLSGGGTQRVRIGERALLGANSGVGISLGDDCIVEAGLYVTAGTKVILRDEPPTASGQPRSVKAATLSGSPGLLFRRNSLTGAIEVLHRSGVGVQLNSALHA